MKVVIFLCLVAAAVSIECYWGTRTGDQDFDDLVEANTITTPNCTSNTMCYITWTSASETNTYGCGECSDSSGWDCSNCDEDLCNGSATATAAALVVAAAYWIFQ